MPFEPTIRLSKWLKDAYPALSNRHVEEAIEAGLVRGTDGSSLRKGFKIALPPDCSRLEAHLSNLRKGTSSLKGVSVIHKEKDFLIVDKPAGIPSHPLSLFDCETMTAWVLAHYPLAQKEWKDKIQPTLCAHRLDTDTSGILVVCLTQDSYKEWRDKFSKRKMRKSYLAWCWGKPQKNSFESSFSIAHHSKDPRKMVVLKTPTTKHRPPVLVAKTKFHVLRVLADKFLVHAEMSTGVTHQVRVHLASLGFPLVGDKLYDEKWMERPLREKGHLLRAITVEGANFRVDASKRDFEDLF